MNKAKIIMDLSKLSNPNLKQKTEVIISSLTNNTYFQNPVPTLASVEIALQEFNTADINMKEGGKVEQVIKKEKRKQLLGLLSNLALYIQFEGSENEVALASSGFSLYKTKQPIGILPKPKNFTATATNVGMIKLKLQAIYGAKSYQYEYKKVSDTVWQTVVHTKSDILLTQLTSGSAYEFKVAGIGSHAERIYSDTLTSFIL